MKRNPSSLPSKSNLGARNMSLERGKMREQRRSQDDDRKDDSHHSEGAKTMIGFAQCGGSRCRLESETAGHGVSSLSRLFPRLASCLQGSPRSVKDRSFLVLV
mmetsp:Transcript_23130/g.92485  ORF Transcript_23130/g.92485 Transcript_23130/m.92485 type:complete len:103 (+) Transcript_23130:535-843(+)